MDQALFQRMQEAALRFRSGESDVEEIETPNGLARLVRDPTNPLGFRIDFVGEGARRSVPIQEYPPSPVRLPGYPAPLPFLPNCAASVSSLDQSVTWDDPPEPERALERVARACLDDGWVARRPTGGGSESAHYFDKDGVERSLRLTRDGGRARLVLSERRVSPSGS